MKSHFESLFRWCKAVENQAVFQVRRKNGENCSDWIDTITYLGKSGGRAILLLHTTSEDAQALLFESFTVVL